MKALYIVLLVTFFGCKSSDFTDNKGNFSLKGKTYTFSDSDIRNLKITFINESMVTVSNSVAGLQAPNYHRYNFTTKYPVEKIDLYRYVIGKPIEKTDSLGGKKYVHPFRKESFNSRKDVFPNVVNDTLFFNRRFEQLQLKDFSFVLKK